MTAGRTVAITTGILAAVGLVVVTSSAPWRMAADVGVPTARVDRGSLTFDMHLTGEFRATRSIPLTAPPAENPLRLVSLEQTGNTVRAGDIVMEFDPVDEMYQLQQSQSELLEAEQEIAKLEADEAVQAAEAKTELLTARFDIRRAELDVLGGERFHGRVEMQRRELAVEEARRRLMELVDASPEQSATHRAELAVLQEKQTQAQLTVDRARQVIDSLVVRAPMDGVVVVRENWDFNFGYAGMTLPEIQVGDTAYRGRPVLEVVDVSQLEILARIPENERPNVEVGQAASLVVDGRAGETFTATVEAIAGMASSDTFFFSATPTRLFDVVLTLDVPDLRLRPGTTAQIVVAGRQLDDVLYVPPQAIFDRDGQTTVYVGEDDGFVPRPVNVISSSTGRVAIEGIAEGEHVALVDPTDQAQPAPTSTSPGVGE